MSRRRPKSNRIKLTAVLIGALLVVLLLVGIYAIRHHSAMIPCGDENAEAPKLTAKSALLYSVDLDKVIYSKKADTKYAPYSITKLVTAYIAANELDGESVVTVSRNAANDSYEGSTMFLREGEEVTVEQLLYGTILLSGNDAATALAEEVAGGEDEFAEMMNETVREWGCKNTHFANPTGWQDKDQYTTANDLLIILQHVMSDEIVSKIALTKEYKMPATNLYEERKMKNHTPYARYAKSGVLGGKTGFWDYDDCSVALVYKKHELTAMMILLKDTDKGRNNDIKKLIKYAHAATPGYIVDEKGAGTGKVWIKGGKKTHVKTVLSDAAYAYPKNGSKLKVRVKIEHKKLQAPVSKGAKAGTYTVYVDGEAVGSHYILLAESVGKGMVLSKFYISDRVGITIFLVILVLILTIILLRIYNKKKARKRRAERLARQQIESEQDYFSRH